MKDKKALREEILKIRRNLFEEEKIRKDNKIINDLMNTEIYKKSKRIFVYVSFNDEINTKDFIAKALSENKIIAVPKTYKENKEMKAVIINSLNDLQLSSFNILEPKDDKGVLNKEEIDLVIVPGSVFDLSLNRIGYGGGYYDKFLKEIKDKKNKIALAYDFQIVEEIKVEYYDIKVDEIITEKRILNMIIKH